MKGANVVVYENRCIKFVLPDKRTVDLLSNALNEMLKWQQNENIKPESCGFLLGYKNQKTNNITISKITSPGKKDYRTKFFCKLIDIIHFNTIKSEQEKGNYYMGVWHTHPQNIPIPSTIDWKDWYEVLEKDRTGSEYAFFIIIGTEQFRIWVGDYKSKKIEEIFEASSADGIYTNEG